MVVITVNLVVILHVIFVWMENVINVKVDMKCIIMNVALFVKDNKVMHLHYSNNVLNNKKTVLTVNINVQLTVLIAILEYVFYVMSKEDGTLKLMEHVILFVGME